MMEEDNSDGIPKKINQSNKNDDAQRGSSTRDVDHQPDHYDSAVLHSLINPAEAEAIQQYLDEECETMKAQGKDKGQFANEREAKKTSTTSSTATHTRSTNEAKSAEEYDAAEISLEVVAEQAGLATVEHPQEEQEDLKKAYKTTPTPSLSLLQMTTEIKETAKIEKLAKNSKEATKRGPAPTGDTHQQGDMIQQTTVYQTRQQSRRRTTKDKAAKQVTRARLGISNHVQANKLEKTTGMPAKGLRGNTGPAAAGAHHIKPCAAVSGAHARSNTLETTGMPAKGLRGNTGPAAAGAHNIKPSAAVSGAHARANTLEETTGMPVKGLQGNTGPTAAGAHQAKPSAAVGGALPLLRGLGKNRTTTVEATNATNYHGAYTCENLQRVQSLDFEPVHNNNHNENENEYVINENEIEYAINDPDIVLLPPTNDQGLVEARPIMEESESQVLQEAQQVDHILEQRADREEKEKECHRVGFAIVACSLAIIAISLCVGLRPKSEIIQTPSPTVHVFMEPSGVPSSTPSGFLDLLLDNLPSHTLASINNGSETPQWRAWNWLANHQNITLLPEWRKEQLFALATFFYAFEGEKWNRLIKGHGWMDDTVEECNWFSNGFGYFEERTYVDYDNPSHYSCNSHGKVTSLWLEDLQLSGLAPFIPPEVTMLSSLSRLQLGFNKIATSISSLIPAEVYEMTGLTGFGLYFEQVTGQIPSELGQLTDLYQLFLLGNQLSGQIPSEIGRLTGLRDLWLLGNQLTGPIPSELGQLTGLSVLWMFGNQFTGRIPSELGSLANMSSLELSQNQFSGPLPSELGRLSGVSHFGCSENQFTGPVPSEFGQLIGLTVLRLAENQLTGSVPSELGLLTNLEAFNLTGNLGLSGTIPEKLCFLPNVSCTVYEDDDFFDNQPCHVDFDCTSILCGCDCACSNSSLM